METYIIGDIHGNFDALSEVLSKSGVNIHKDKLIFLGDYTDRGLKSAEVVDRLCNIQDVTKNQPNEAVFIKGNHDHWVLEYLKYGNAQSIWLMQGGKETYHSFYKWFEKYPEHRERFLTFFNTLHNYYIDDENRGFVHGGFTSKYGLGNEPYESNYYWDRDLWALAMSIKDLNNPSSFIRFKKHKEIYIGHTSTCNWDVKPHYPEYNNPHQSKNGQITIPMNRHNVWNIDTGAGHTGKLTIMNINTKEFWQSG